MSDDELERKVVNAVDSIPVPPDLVPRLAALRPARPVWRSAAMWGLVAATALFAVAVAFVAPEEDPPLATPAQDDDERVRALRSLEKRILRALEDPNLKEEFALVRTTARFGNDAVPFLRELLNRFLSAATAKDLTVTHAGDIVATLRAIDTDESAGVLLDAMENPDLIFPQKYSLLGGALERMKSGKIGPRVVKHYRWSARYLGDDSVDACGLLRAVARRGGSDGIRIVRELYQAGKADLADLGVCEDTGCAELFAKDYFALQVRERETMTGAMFTLGTLVGNVHFHELSLAARKELVKRVFEVKPESEAVATALWRDASPEFVELLTQRLKTATPEALAMLAGGFAAAAEARGSVPKHAVTLCVPFLANDRVLRLIREIPADFRTPEIRAALARIVKESPDAAIREAAQKALDALGP